MDSVQLVTHVHLRTGLSVQDDAMLVGQETSLLASSEPSLLKFRKKCVLNQEEWMLTDDHYRKSSREK